MIVVREANRDDAPEISRIFRACYGKDYAYPQFYDLELLTKMIYTDDTVILVAEDEDTGELLGTASAIASKHTRVAVLTNDELNQLVRQRPDIGLLLYRNLAHGLGEKLQRQDLVVSEKKES